MDKETKKRPVGRPKMDKHLAKNETFKVRVTKLEAERLYIMSAKTGKSMSEIVREAVNETLKSFDETEKMLKHE